MKTRSRVAPALLCASLFLIASAPIFAQGARSEEGEGLVECKMVFNLRGWSAFYKTAKGGGTIRCSNGQKARVRITAKGGGITFGKSDVIGGKGTFTAVRSIEELFGSYAQSEVHAGAVKSADAQALTKGEVSLVLAGTGRGIDIGFAFGKLTIRRAK
jgi:hypothetical protein